MPEFGKEHVAPAEPRDDEADKPTNSEVEQALRDLQESERAQSPEDAEQAAREQALSDGRRELEELKKSAAEDVPDDVQRDERLTEIAKEVLNGEWGTGQESRLKLAEAGIDHLKVQDEMVRIVNEHLET